MLNSYFKFNAAEILLLLFPLFVISGPFLSDLSIVILGLTTIYFFFIKKINFQYEIKNNSFLLLFFFFCIIATYTNYGFDINFFKSLSFIRFIFFIIIMSYFLNYNNKKIKNLSLIILFLTLSFVCFDSYIQFFFGKDIFGYELLDPKRLSGPFGDEYILGSFLLNFSPLLFYFCSKIHKYKNYLLPFFFIIIEPLIFLAGQRSAFFMSLILIFGILFFFYKDRFFYLNFFLSLLIIILICTFNNNYYERYIFDVKANFSYDNKVIIKDKEKILDYSIITPIHTTLYISAINGFLDKPILGHGIKSFKEKCPTFKGNACSNHPHNYFLEILFETGIMGFLILSYFYIKLMINFLIKLKDIFLHNKLNNNYFILLSLLIFFFPFKSTGSIFNNYILAQASYFIGLYLYETKKSK